LLMRWPLNKTRLKCSREASTVAAAIKIIITEARTGVVETTCLAVNEAATEATVTIGANVGNIEAIMNSEVVTTRVNKAAGVTTILTSNSSKKNKMTSKLFKTLVSRTTITEVAAEAVVTINHVREATEETINAEITTIEVDMLRRPEKTVNLNKDTLIIEGAPTTSSLLHIGAVVALLTARKRSEQGLRSRNKLKAPTIMPSEDPSC